MSGKYLIIAVAEKVCRTLRKRLMFDSFLIQKYSKVFNKLSTQLKFNRKIFIFG